MIRRPPRSTRTDTRFPYTTLFRSRCHLCLGETGDGDTRVCHQLELPARHPTDGEEEAAFIAVRIRCRQLGCGEHRGAAFVDGHLVDRKSNTSELQSLMRISYAVFCLKKQNRISLYNTTDTHTN